MPRACGAIPARDRRAGAELRFRWPDLRLEVRDDGVGGASLNRSTGLLRLQDRAAAMGGELHIESPPGAGTTVTATLPIAVSRAA